MESQYTQEEDCTESITCTYSVNEVNDAFDKAVKIYASSLQMDGFRKGKVPASLVEQRIGEELLFKVAELLSHSAYKVVNEAKGVLLSSGLTPKGETDDDLVLPQRNTEYTITYTYRCIPEVDIPDYSSVRKELEVEPVTEEEISEAVNELIRQTAPLEESTHTTPQDNDVAILSINIKEKGILIGEQAEYTFALPNKTFLKPLEDTIRVMKKGETKEFSFTFPEATSLEGSSLVSGKTCDITLTLHDIRTIPRVSDGSPLLKKMGYERYDDFKEAYGKLLLEYKTASAKTELQRSIVSSIAERVDCSIPSMFIELYTDAVLDNFESIANSQGFSVNLFASQFKHITEMAERVALEMAKNQVILLNIAKREGLSVTDSEFATFIQQLAQQNGVEAMKLYEEYRENDMLLILYQRLLADKTSLFIYKQAVESTESVEQPQEEKKRGRKKQTQVEE